MGYAKSIEKSKQAKADEKILQLERELSELKRAKAKTRANDHAIDGHVTIERTSKKLKKRLVIGYLLIVLSVMIYAFQLAYAESQGRLLNPCDSYASTATFFTGVIILILTRIKIWWEHE